jgi:hypothetical protein
MAIRRREELHRRAPSAGDEHARDVVAESGGKHPRAIRRIEAFEIADFTFTEDQDARRLEVRVEARERETGLLDVRAGDGAFDAGRAAEEFEREAYGFGPTLEQARDGDGPLHHLQSSIFNLAIGRQIED